MAAAGQRDYHNYFPQQLTPASLGRFPGALWHTEKLNPSRVSRVCPEVSSLLAIRGAQEQSVNVSTTGLSVEKTHYSCLHLDPIVTTAKFLCTKGNQRPASRQMHHKLKYLHMGQAK